MKLWFPNYPTTALLRTISETGLREIGQWGRRLERESALLLLVQCFVSFRYCSWVRSSQTDPRPISIARSIDCRFSNVIL